MTKKQKDIFRKNLKYRYGITPEEYYSLLKKQGNKCAICGKKSSKEGKRFAVDHNHKTGFIRGLLCNYCNTRLMKYLRDNKNRAMGLACYLINANAHDENWE